MQGGVFVGRRREAAAAAAAALCLALLLLTQQVRAGPLVRSDPGQDVTGVREHRRTARMTPLWRIMNSKPFGAYCQNNYECSTGFCRGGHCSISQRSPSQISDY